jgi:hypothetical protein
MGKKVIVQNQTQEDRGYRITSVRIGKSGKVTVGCLVKNSSGHFNKMNFESPESADPNFIEAMQNLAPHLLFICELPEEYEDSVEIRSLRFDYEGENAIMGCAITGIRNIDTSDKPMIIISPYKSSEGENHLSEECERALVTVSTMPSTI